MKIFKRAGAHAEGSVPVASIRHEMTAISLGMAQCEESPAGESSQERPSFHANLTYT